MCNVLKMDWWIIALILIGCVFMLTAIGSCLLIIYNGFTSKRKNKKCKSTKRLDGKTVIVTGGTSGIGIEISKELAMRGAKVIIASRFKERGTQARKYIVNNTGNYNVIFKSLNLASFASVRDFANYILVNEDRLDLLINNAGVMMPDKLTSDGLNFITQVNYCGHFLLTLLLLPILKRCGEPSDPSRIVNVTSKSHSEGRIEFDKLNKTKVYKSCHQVYSNSKLCVTMFTQELSQRLKNCNANTVVNSADPGLVATEISTGGKFSLKKVLFSPFYPNPWEGAQTALYAALDDKTGGVSGEYFVNCELAKAGKNSKDEVLSQKLWDETISTVKLSTSEIRLCLV